MLYSIWFSVAGRPRFVRLLDLVGFGARGLAPAMAWLGLKLVSLSGHSGQSA